MTDPIYNPRMRKLTLAALLVVGISGCVKSDIPNYVITPPTSPSPLPTPTPNPPPTPNSNPAPLSVAMNIGPSRPTAGFSAAFNALVLPVPTPPVTYTWTFGDGGTRVTSSESTVYTIGRAGEYDGGVLVSDGAGRSATASMHFVVVTPPPDTTAPTPAPSVPTLSASLTCTPAAPPAATACNATASYNGTILPSAKITNVDWDWGDQLVDLTSTAAKSHSYAALGTYTVFATVTATTDAGAKTTVTSKELIVKP